MLVGPFGAHRLYLGTTPKVAIIYGMTFGGFGVLVLIDLGHIVFTKDLAPYRQQRQGDHVGRAARTAAHSTVTLLARLRGWSTLQPRITAMW